MNAMLDLKRMLDEDFSILVTPSIRQNVMSVKIEETGHILLCAKVAALFAKQPVQIRFNNDCSAIQICTAEGENNSIMFPKSGRKAVPNAAKNLQQHKFPFPVIFNGEVCESGTKWRGERQENPISKPLQTSHATKKK